MHGKNIERSIGIRQPERVFIRKRFALFPLRFFAHTFFQNRPQNVIAEVVVVPVVIIRSARALIERAALEVEFEIPEKIFHVIPREIACAAVEPTQLVQAKLDVFYKAFTFRVSPQTVFERSSGKLANEF